jgi:hypothetical protein
MAEPQIVQPPPTITQPSSPVDNSPGLEQVQKAFDRVLPERKPKGQEPSPQPTPPPPPSKEAPPPETKEAPPKEKEAPKEEFPSFLKEALELETPPPSKPAAAPPGEPEVEWSEELPVEEKKSRIKGLRDAYKKVKTELETLQKRPQIDPRAVERMSYLEKENKQMGEALSRFGVEQSAEFQQQVIAPLVASWNEAARIVKEAGADPEELAKAMALTGRAQFEALDSLFMEMPESAKAEAHDALRAYRRFDDMRRRAIVNAPQTLEGIRKRETERQYHELNRQREDMKGMFDRALSTLRDEAKVELFQKSNDENAKWWNEQGDRIIAQGRDLFLENTSLDKVALACLLAPAADAYRSLFLKSQRKVAELQKVIKDKFENEPNLSESPGNAGALIPESQMAEDLKKPFADVFLREFHRSQQRNK